MMEGGACRLKPTQREGGSAVRFILRRLVFYVIAFWAAITLNFLLPRLMPGSPLDGLILRYGTAIQNNPDLIAQLKASLGSADEPIWRAYPDVPPQHPHRQPRNVDGPAGTRHGDHPQHAAVFDLPRRLRLHPLVRDRHVPRHARSVASRRHHRSGRHAGPDGAAVVPGVLPQSRRRLLPRAQARVVPDPARVLERHRARLHLGLRRRRIPPRPAAQCS